MDFDWNDMLDPQLFCDILPDNEGLCDAVPSFDSAGYHSGQKCTNCGANDWTREEQRGDMVCVSCGLCDGGIFVAPPPHANEQQTATPRRVDQRKSDGGVSNNSPTGNRVRRRISRRAKSANYKRYTYLKQRLSQWHMADPDIDPDSWEFISEQFLDFVLRTHGWMPHIPSTTELRECHGIQIEHTFCLDKRGVRSILNACDAIILADTDSEQPPTYTRRFLKKWVSIRWKFSGVQGTSRYTSPVFLELLCEDFQKVERAFEIVIQHRFKRKAMCYNEFINRLMELHRFGDLAKDFPPLNTSRAKQRTYIYWWHICKYLQWPFLCNESKILKYIMKKI